MVMMEGGCGIVFEFSESCSIFSKRNLSNAAIHLQSTNSGFLARRHDAEAKPNIVVAGTFIDCSAVG